jgi:hypothetical protein
MENDKKYEMNHLLKCSFKSNSMTNSNQTQIQSKMKKSNLIYCVYHKYIMILKNYLLFLCIANINIIKQKSLDTKSETQN